MLPYFGERVTHTQKKVIALDTISTNTFTYILLTNFGERVTHTQKKVIALDTTPLQSMLLYYQLEYEIVIHDPI